ncbi:fad binding domain protein [Colletotrichum incanum]|uniref:Fad binding domain protein n=1 Tax=Colletotrichum incanum TaxID=1573173 RepID=A0A167BTW4_COLIC|nr:fad binding domain protein [Colletotrichum incanum]
MPRMKVLISGGGIAGNSLAFWLSKLGHDITVVEWFPTLRATGLQLDLRGHDIEVMRRMGLEEAFRAKSAPEQGLEFVDSSGRRRAHFPANKSGQGLQSFTTDFEIMRGDLCRLFYDATGDRTQYVFGTSVEHFEEKDDDLEVEFKNGKKDRFDLLVGADGQGSRTRKMMNGTHTPDAFVLLRGLHTSYFTIPQPIQEGEGYNATAYMGTGNRFLMTRRQSPHEMQAYLMCRDNSERFQNARRAGRKEQKELVAEIFRGTGWRTEEILGHMMESEDFYCETIGLVKRDNWSQGRVTLLGDAAYCPSSMTGMGTTSAVVGAYTLAGEIGKHCATENTRENLATALKAYESKFRPFMDQVQEGISEGGLVWKLWPTGPFGISIFNTLVGVASYLKMNVLGEWILRENVMNWDLPEYDEMWRD